jgi:hypothetical protein
MVAPWYNNLSLFKSFQTFNPFKRFQPHHFLPSRRGEDEERD